MSPSEAARALDTSRIREDFPALAQRMHGRPLVYLDSASTAQKPRVVVEAVRQMLEEGCANIHRGVHALSVAATDRYEAARETVRAVRYPPLGGRGWLSTRSASTRPGALASITGSAR